MLLNEQLGSMRHVAKASRDLRESMEGGQLNKLLHGLGFSLSGWLASLLQTTLTVIIVIIMFYILLSCVKSVLTQLLICQIVHGV